MKKKLIHSTCWLTFTSLLLLGSSVQAAVHSYAIASDAGFWDEAMKDVQSSMQLGRINQLIMAGDNLWDEMPNYEYVWSHWTDFKLDVVAIGNHHTSYEEEIAFFQMPNEYYTKRVDEDLRFIVLNSDNEHNIQEQADWLEKQLNQATERYIFVVYHHSPYTLTGRHTWQEKKAFHQAIRPILRNYRDKLTALITGHDHITTLVELDDLPFIVSGSVHQALPSRELDYYASNGVHVKTVWRYNQEPHWTRLDVDTERGAVWLNFVRVQPSKVVCSVRIDKLSLHVKDNCRR